MSRFSDANLNSTEVSSELVLESISETIKEEPTPSNSSEDVKVDETNVEVNDEEQQKGENNII